MREFGGGRPKTEDSVYTCTATESIGDAVYISGADNVRQADASSTSTMPAIGIIVAKPSSTQCLVRTKGIVKGLSGLTAGSRYFISTAAGGITATAPTGSGEVVQYIGVAKSTTELEICPNLDYSVVP